MNILDLAIENMAVERGRYDIKVYAHGAANTARAFVLRHDGIVAEYTDRVAAQAFVDRRAFAAGMQAFRMAACDTIPDLLALIDTLADGRK